jgi:wyosine [tRNA(Phe)-imidazoG37] synthetase (radical SAM superfamily)
MNQDDTMDIPADHHIAFGPVPSRRLGQSLGINNVTSKACSYTCVYCQVGPTTQKIIEPQAFFSPAQVHAAVAARVARLRDDGQAIDFLSFVPDGEPTLDIALGESIDALRDLEIPIAVITNGTLLWREDVRARVGRADLVSVKVDSVHEDAWRQIDLPHRDLSLDRILDGIRRFAADYAGTLITDTMLIAGVNDDPASLTDTADFLAGIAPHTAYLAVPTRPTTVAKAHGTDEAGLIRAHQIFAARLSAVELLTGHELGEFAHTGDARSDLLAVTAVHPMREDAVRRLLERDHAGWELVQGLLDAGMLRSTLYEGERFYLRPVRRKGR